MWHLLTIIYMPVMPVGDSKISTSMLYPEHIPASFKPALEMQLCTSGVALV